MQVIISTTRMRIIVLVINLLDKLYVRNLTNQRELLHELFPCNVFTNVNLCKGLALFRETSLQSYTGRTIILSVDVYFHT